MVRPKKPDRPANLAAQALRDDLFRSRKVRSRKTYSRKIKHRKGERDERFPFSMFAFTNEITENKLIVRNQHY